MYVLYRNGKDCKVIYLKVLLIRPRDLIALEVALWHCRDGLRVLEHHIPKSFSSVVFSKTVLPPSNIMSIQLTSLAASLLYLSIWEIFVFLEYSDVAKRYVFNWFNNGSSVVLNLTVLMVNFFSNSSSSSW